MSDCLYGIPACFISSTRNSCIAIRRPRRYPGRCSPTLTFLCGDAWEAADAASLVQGTRCERDVIYYYCVVCCDVVLMVSNAHTVHGIV